MFVGGDDRREDETEGRPGREVEEHERGVLEMRERYHDTTSNAERSMPSMSMPPVRAISTNSASV